MNKSNSKILVGTGRLGRHESKEKDNHRIEALKFLLSEGCGIHISPTYDDSFRKLSRVKELNHCEKIISKIDFSRQSFPEIQLELTENLINGQKFSVQIAGDIRNIINDNFRWENFENYLISLKNKFYIEQFFISPLYHDSEYFLKLKAKATIPLSLALHYSLFELEFKSTLIKNKNKKTKVLALRGFGESINSFGNWYSPLGMEIKPKSIINRQIKDKNILLRKYNLKEKEARLIFALKNPNIDYTSISFSNIKQAKEALLINKSNYDMKILEDLYLLSKKSNISRKGLGFKYPENVNYLSFYPYLTILRKGVKSRGLIIFSAKNIFYKFTYESKQIIKLFLNLFLNKKF